MKDYIAETKKCLEGYKENKEMLESKMKLLNRLKEENKSSEREIGLTSIRYDEVPAKTNKVTSKVEQIAIKNAQLEIELEEQIESIRYYLSRLDMALEEIKPVWKEILVLKYIENNTWEYTARKSGQSEATCKRYAKEGVKAMADKIVGQKSYIDLPLFRDIYLGQVVE